jgi:phospholipid-transporting ATPase
MIFHKTKFRRYYNIYFLLGALVTFTGYSSLSWTTQLTPLLIVLTFSGIKEAYEDFVFEFLTLE